MTQRRLHRASRPSPRLQLRRQIGMTVKLKVDRERLRTAHPSAPFRSDFRSINRCRTVSTHTATPCTDDRAAEVAVALDLGISSPDGAPGMTVPLAADASPHHSPPDLMCFCVMWCDVVIILRLIRRSILVTPNTCTLIPRARCDRTEKPGVAKVEAFAAAHANWWVTAIQQPVKVKRVMKLQIASVNAIHSFVITTKPKSGSFGILARCHLIIPT